MPRWKEEITKRLAGLKLEPAREAEIVEELTQHLEDRYAQLLNDGATREGAHSATLAELSDSQRLAQRLRAVEHANAEDSVVPGLNRRRNMIADLWQDLRYTVRVLGKNPLFTISGGGGAPCHLSAGAPRRDG